MTTHDSPTSRVLAFVEDFHAVWRELYERVQDGGDFDIWGAAIGGLEQSHFAPEVVCPERYSIGSPCPHAPGVERVLEVDERADVALVLTQSSDFHYFDYELVRSEGAWKIAHLRQTAADPRSPLMSAEELAAALAAPTIDAPLEPTSKREDPSHSLFDEGRVITLQDVSEPLRVRHVGALNVVSGVLAVQDFGYDAYDLAPLTRRVPTGRYPVEVSTVFGRNAALRILFGDPDRVVGWHPADVVGGGHVAGVDAGNLAVFDLATYGTLSVREKERLYEDAVVHTSQHPASTMLSMSHDDDGVVADSGWGDGAYPCHWGVDADGNVVVLLIDFLVACQWPEETLSFRVSAADIGSSLAEDLLQPFDAILELHASSPTQVLLVSNGANRLTKIRFSDDSGNELSSTDQLGSQWSGQSVSWTLPPQLVARMPLTFEVLVGRGYRN